MNESHCSDVLSSPTFCHSHLVRLVYLGKGLGGFLLFCCTDLTTDKKALIVLELLFYDMFGKICLGSAGGSSSSALLSRVDWCGLIVWKDLVGSATIERNKLLRVEE